MRAAAASRTTIRLASRLVGALPLSAAPAAGSLLTVHSGYIGGDRTENPPSLAVGPDGAMSVAGTTFSTETSFPVVAGPDLSFGGGSSDAWVGRVALDGTHLLYAGYVGGSAPTTR